MSTKTIKINSLFINIRIIVWILLVVILLTRYLTTRTNYLEGQTVRVHGRVLTEPTRYSSAQGIDLKGLKIYLPSFPEVFYGDQIVVQGKVEGGKLQNAKLLDVVKSGGVFSFRNKLVNFLKTSLPEPSSSLVAGIVLGSKANIPNWFLDALKKSGTIHVVVASGMNVTMTANALISILILFFSRRKAVILGIIGIWFYVLMSGFDAPLVRSAIMSSLAFSAQRLGKLSYSINSLLLSAFVMLFINPDWANDLGFILSFTSTASLILFETKVSSLMSFVPSILREDIATSLTAQIAVGPILYVVFGQLNIFSPIINGLVLWTIAPIMAIGSLGMAVGIVFPALGKIILYLCYPLTWWFIKVVTIL